VPDWAALDFADGAAANFSVVDAPHDFIITGANETESPFVNDSSLKGQAYIPKTVGVYRKHFALPADWAGSHVEAYFDGVFAVTSAFLNGVPVMNHSGSGYTSFAVRLDNVTGAAFGAENVLALFVDATIMMGAALGLEGEQRTRERMATQGGGGGLEDLAGAGTGDHVGLALSGLSLPSLALFGGRPASPGGAQLPELGAAYAAATAGTARPARAALLYRHCDQVADAQQQARRVCQLDVYRHSEGAQLAT
jgi:hypothetical protein